MEGVERMTTQDHTRTITAAKDLGGARLLITWSGGVSAEIDVSDKVRQARRTDGELGEMAIGDWGHSLSWANGLELGADTLWLATLSATGHDDARTFLEWRLRHGLSLSKAAAALGLSRRTVAYYSNGERPVPKAILLACRGWEVSEEAA
jgi:hypothetical protein